MNLLQRYTLRQIFYLAFQIILSKVFIDRSVRIIRFPCHIRGIRFIDFGHSLTTGTGCRMDAFPQSKKTCIRFGKNVQINDYVHIGAIDSVSIGNNVLIASNVFITDHNHGYYDGTSSKHSSPLIHPMKRPLKASPVIIEDNVWLGEHVSILPGSHIKEGSIIGTMSVVNSEIPPYSMAVGSPARVIKKYDFTKQLWVKI